MVIFLAWSSILCIIILNLHVSSNETKEVLTKLTEVYQVDKKDLRKNIHGLTDSEQLDITIGKRQTVIGLFSIVSLLFVFLAKPFSSELANIIIFVANGLIISSLIGYMVEGIFVWCFPDIPSEEGEGED